MSGAQGALPPGSWTATTYESVEGGENRSRVDIRARDTHEDQGSIQIDKMQDKVEDAAGGGGPVFGAGAAAAAAQGDKAAGDQDNPDMGVTGTA